MAKHFFGYIRVSTAKQGIYPLGAPIGYLDQGGGKPKTPDPIAAPLVRKAFELYATGRHTLDTLGAELDRLGLRRRRGGRVTRTGLSTILNNPFYIGIIKLRKTGETFQGIHQPIVTAALFNRVQAVLTGKTNTRIQRHDFLFRRLLACRHCGYSLIGSQHKGHVYYRCQIRTCPTTCIREEIADAAIRQALAPLQFSPEEKAYLQAKLPELRGSWESQRKSEVKTMTLRQGQLQDRLNRLTDAFLDGTIEKPLFEERKAALLMERKVVEEKLSELRQNNQAGPDRVAEFLELAGSALLSYEMGLPEEKRDLLKILTSNRSVDGKNVAVRLQNPFEQVANREKSTSCAQDRDRPRTLDAIWESLLAFFRSNPTVPLPRDCRIQ